MQADDVLLEVKDLKTYFHTFAGLVKAVDGVSFSLRRGGILGIVGESGCGKSVTGFSILKLIEPPGRIDEGEINFEGRSLIEADEREMQRIRGKEISMIFQDPMTSLNPLYTVQNQVEEVLRLHENLSAGQRRERCIRLLSSVGIAEAHKRLGDYPHQFSGGMRQRVIIATALAASPKLIIADEPTTALDVTIQAQILKLLKTLVVENETSLILITHDLAVVSEICQRVIVMYSGKLVESGPTDALLSAPRHPYTAGLLASIPKIDESAGRRLNPIPGVVPDILDLPPGCLFAPRCAYRQELCTRVEPRPESREAGRSVACHFPLLEQSRG